MSVSFNLSSLNGTVHFDESYMNYEFNWKQFPTAFATLPWIYMIPSFLVICEIFNVYINSNWKKAEPGKNQHVFLIISLSQFTCFALFFSDFWMTRLPSTGIFTSYCATIPPNHWLKCILFAALYFNYLAMSFPFLLPVIRLIIVTFPKRHVIINTILIRYGVPLILLFPICFTFYLIPALGVCKQRASPYPFGAIWIYYINSAFGLRNSFFHLYNLIFWMTLSIIANFLLFYQVGQARSRLIRAQTSGTSKRAHTSITITTLAMITFYVTNGSFLLMYIFYYGTNSYFSYAEIIRPFGNDLQTCVVTWVFYLTHPAFQKKKSMDSDLIFSTSSFRRRVDIII
ncbi:CRE-SRU-4 protein [Caenorhabditis remanei]|uniref:CRE-SRU-4 protein n=1 Tax=Caenorhabditis remanei TaxID=31234 RepID=E3ND80_CAERE|nr:CRE-SRU-4 protein [Caenorhabditis remanei]